ncbi:MAG: PIN domain-containing protein [Gammaproteobacteria bacterium]|nr:PIN domain-containing protein [Gammaproteobacteria bacterium]
MSKKLICWDSSVFIDWLRDEESTNPERLPLIQSVIEKAENGECQLLASALVLVEVLEKATPGGGMGKFENLLGSSRIVRAIPANVFVAQKARKIRNHFYPDKKISVPDAVHIATAIVSKADVLHTSDDRLLSLNGAPEVDRLAITELIIP